MERLHCGLVYNIQFSVVAVATQEKVVPAKKEETVNEEHTKDLDEAMETEKEIENKQRRLVGPARPVQPVPVTTPPSSEVQVHTIIVNIM